ncbi:hypothetical protein R1flu_025394 [Riccia fluitans]|uniref:R3H domain-containing protein n=1 Tax=Riccia fluitans TaxID=41844 RepID=A0ABD1XXM2_9MARC
MEEARETSNHGLPAKDRLGRGSIAIRFFPGTSSSVKSKIVSSSFGLLNEFVGIPFFRAIEVAAKSVSQHRDTDLATREPGVVMDESSGNFSRGSVDEVASFVGQIYLGDEAGGRGDPRSQRGASSRGYRRGGFHQRGRNFQNVTRQDRASGEAIDSLSDSPRSGEFSASGVSGLPILNAYTSPEVLGFPRENSHDDRRTNAGGEGSFRGDRPFGAVAEPPSPLDDYRNFQNDHNTDFQNYRGNQQQRHRVGYEANRFGGSRRGGGRAQRFSERTSSNGSQTPPQTGRRGGRVYHDAEHPRRADVVRRGRQDENRQEEFPGSGIYSGVEQGTAAQLEYSEYASSEFGSTTSSNYRREGRFVGDAGFVNRSGSSSSYNEPSENSDRVKGGGDDVRSAIREAAYRGNKSSGGQQGQRRDSQQKPAGRGGAQAENGGSLWRAKKSQVPQLVQELEERLTRGTIECMICYDMWRLQRLVLVARRHSLADVASKKLSAVAGTFVSGSLCVGAILAPEFVMKDLAKLARSRNAAAAHPRGLSLVTFHKEIRSLVEAKKKRIRVFFYVKGSAGRRRAAGDIGATTDAARWRRLELELLTCSMSLFSRSFLVLAPCGAPRRECAHTCVASCHPSTPCPDNRCKVVVRITCGCGRMSGEVPCDAGGNGTRLSAETEMILSRLPGPLQPLPQGSERVALGQRKMSCDDECAKLEKRRLLADAFGVEMSGDGTGGDAKSSELLLNEMVRRDPQWILAVEERFKSLLLGPKSQNLKVHVFCPMPKEKREVIHLLAERWSLSVSSAGREPRRFPIAHVTNKSKVPYTRLLSKSQTLPSPGLFPPPAFNPAVDMEPGLVIAFYDVPREVDMSGLVLRFAGECELVWLNDKNALAVFGDAARAATALRRVDHTSVYKGAISVPGSAVHSKGAWGQAAAAGSSFAAKASAKKKAVQQESSSWVEDAWGEENRKTSKEQLTGAWQRKDPPITIKNPWGALEQTKVRAGDAQLRDSYVSSQPLHVSTKEGENSAQAERTRLKPATTSGGEEEAGPSGVSKGPSFTSQTPENGSLVQQNSVEDDWERLLD